MLKADGQVIRLMDVIIVASLVIQAKLMLERSANGMEACFIWRPEGALDIVIV